MKAVLTVVSALVIFGVAVSNSAESQQAQYNARAASVNTSAAAKYVQESSAANQARIDNAPKIEPVIVSRWRTKTYKSEKDDSQNAQAVLPANDYYDNGHFHRGYPTMNILCRENSTSLYFNVADEFLSDNANWGTLKFRIDDGKIFSKSLSESTNNQALGMWSGSGIAFLKSLHGADTLKVWITPYNENETMLEFDVSDITNQLTDVRTNCHW